MARNFVAANPDGLKATVTPITGYPFTIACWFKPVAANVAYNFFNINDNIGTNVFQLICGAIGNLRFNTPATIAQAGGAFTAGVWGHACAVATSSTLRACFRDGANKGTNVTSYVPSGLTQVHIGILIASNGFNGDLAECAIWNIALSDAEVALIGSTTTPISPLLVHPESLVFYAPLISGASPEIDLMSSNTLTVTGATVSVHPPIHYPSRHGRFRYGTTAVTDILFGQAIM